VSEDVEASAGGWSSREQVVRDLREAREYAKYKSLGDGKLRDSEKENLRIRYIRVLVSAANAERKLLKDRDLDEMVKELEALLDEGEP
jgi:hypothetical protein